MGEQGEFQCLRCSTCCRNILETKDGFRRGLPLTEEETRLFPSEVVSPKLAVGLKEPEKIVLYQLNVNVCPHVSHANMCTQYSERPLICRSFPVVAGAISNRCKVFGYRKVGVEYDEPFAMAEQLKASERLEKYIQNQVRKHRKKGWRFWEYDLAAGKWVSVG